MLSLYVRFTMVRLQLEFVIAMSERRRANIRDNKENRIQSMHIVHELCTAILNSFNQEVRFHSSIKCTMYTFSMGYIVQCSVVLFNKCCIRLNWLISLQCMFVFVFVCGQFRHVINWLEEGEEEETTVHWSNVLIIINWCRNIIFLLLILLF